MQILTTKEYRNLVQQKEELQRKGAEAYQEDDLEAFTRIKNQLDIVQQCIDEAEAAEIVEAST